MLTIRNAKAEDVESILEIYGYYVKNTAVSFEYEIPTLKEFEDRMKKIMRVYPYLVAVLDGRIVGYAYAAALNSRAAYAHSCESSIYIDKAFLGQGLGKKLYIALEEAVLKMGIFNIYACVAYPTEEDVYLTTNSVDFHLHNGYKKVGEFHKCGCKFGKWYNIIWMEKLLSEHK